MISNRRYTGTLAYVNARWPLYLFGFGGGFILTALAATLGWARGWWALLPATIVLLLLLAYFLATSLWAAHQLHDDSLGLAQVMVELGQIRPTDTIVHVDLGLCRPAVNLSRHLTTGRIIIVDVYNPQLTPGRALARQRQQTQHPPADPRRQWRDGRLDLLPFPDNVVPAATLVMSASEFWQHGDRLILLKEIRRILILGGRLLLVERVRNRNSFLLFGPAALRLRPAAYWRALLTEAGYERKAEHDARGVVHCFRADKPDTGLPRQLTFDLVL